MSSRWAAAPKAAATITIRIRSCAALIASFRSISICRDVLLQPKHAVRLDVTAEEDPALGNDRKTICVDFMPINRNYRIASYASLWMIGSMPSP